MSARTKRGNVALVARVSHVALVARVSHVALVALLGLLALAACASAPERRTAGPDHPALAGPAAPEAAAPSPFDTTVTYLPDGARTPAGQALPAPPARPATEPAAAAGYTCVMHPDVHTAEPGDCPICGMTLVPAGDGGKR